jgi:predicted HTH domain antitoxin
MNTQTTNLTVQKVLELAQNLSLVDQCALIESLNRQIEASLPEHATVDEAIALYLAEKCSLGRAAELANITRWEMIDILKKRNIPIIVDTDFTAAKMDAIAEELEHEGILC